jgi:hypothetical protein
LLCNPGQNAFAKENGLIFHKDKYIRNIRQIDVKR